MFLFEYCVIDKSFYNIKRSEHFTWNCQDLLNFVFDGMIQMSTIANREFKISICHGNNNNCTDLWGQNSSITDLCWITLWATMLVAEKRLKDIIGHILTYCTILLDQCQGASVGILSGRSQLRLELITTGCSSNGRMCRVWCWSR